MKKFHITIKNNNDNLVSFPCIISYTIPLNNPIEINLATIFNLNFMDKEYVVNDNINFCISKEVYIKLKSSITKNNLEKKQFFNYLCIAMNTLYYHYDSLYNKNETENEYININNKKIKLFMDSRLLPLFFVFELENLLPVESNSLPFIHYCRRKFYQWLIFWHISPLMFQSMLQTATKLTDILAYSYENHYSEYQKYLQNNLYTDLLVTHLGTKAERIILSYSKYYFKSKLYDTTNLEDIYPESTHNELIKK